MGLGERLARSAARVLINERRYSVQGHRLFFKTAMAVGMSMPAGASTALEDAGGVPVLRVDGLQGSQARDLFLLHGGGFEAGSAKSHVPACAGLCAGLGATGLVTDYRRPPRVREFGDGSN